MSAHEPLTFDVLNHPEDAPIILVGQPTALQGELQVQNPGSETLVLRDVHLRSLPQKAAATEQGTLALAHTIPTIVLHPGHERRVPLSIAISPHTPPGEYQGQVQAAGHVRPLVVHVTEVVHLGISPSTIVVENHPGETISKNLVFHNLGNVPLTIGEIGPVVLDDELFNCRVARAVVQAVSDQTESINDYLAVMAQQAKMVLEQTGHLRVHNTAGELVLQPGEVRSIDLEIRVPDKLERHSRYRGAVAIYTSDLEFVIVPASSGQATKTSVQPTPAQRRRGGRRA